MPLRTRKHNKISLEEGAEALDIASPALPPSDSKGHETIERELEGAWRESAKLGWSFNKFATAMLEVLTVLHQRDRFRAQTVKQQAGGA